MDISESLRDVAIVKALSGLAGAVVSLRFVPGNSWFERFTLVLGGVACAYYGAELVAEYMDVKNSALGLVGFALGLFGMSLLSKVFEGLAALDAKRMATDAWDWFVRKWKA